MTAPVITFLSDYGYADDFVGVCHGVIASICARARIIDITHSVRRHDVAAGALVLRRALPYMPVGVHLAVVDPSVGSERRAVALELADSRLLVGPDNGLLTLAASAESIVAAVEIASSRWRLEPVSATFHGRDLFAPVAAHLAAGAMLTSAGEPIDPATLVRLAVPTPGRDGDTLVAHVIGIDGFGNVALDATAADLTSADLAPGSRVTIGRGVDLVAGSRIAPDRSADLAPGSSKELSRSSHADARFARTFADVGPGELLLYVDAYGALALAVSDGDAASMLGVTVGDELRVTLT